MRECGQIIAWFRRKAFDPWNKNDTLVNRSQKRGQLNWFMRPGRTSLRDIWSAKHVKRKNVTIKFIYDDIFSTRRQLAATGMCRRFWYSLIVFQYISEIFRDKVGPEHEFIDVVLSRLLPQFWCRQFNGLLFLVCLYLKGFIICNNVWGKHLLS